jgi:hypothetical protein
VRHRRVPAGAVLAIIEHKFYFDIMACPDPDHVRYAQIAAAAARYVQGWEFTAGDEAAAIAELAQAAAGRADLLAERAGTALGFSEGGLEPTRNRRIAELCIAAGADATLMERWVAVGRELAARVRDMPSCRPGR